MLSEILRTTGFHGRDADDISDGDEGPRVSAFTEIGLGLDEVGGYDGKNVESEAIA